MADTNHNSGPRVHARGSNGAAGDNDDWSAAIERMRGAYAEKTIGRYSRDLCCSKRGAPIWSLVALPTEPAAIEKNHIETLVVVALERRAIWGACTFCLISTMQGRPKPPGCRCGTSVVFVRPARQSKAINPKVHEQMLAACGQDLAGLRDKTLFALGFEGLCQRAEITALTVADFDIPPIKWSGRRSILPDGLQLGVRVHLSEIVTPSGRVNVRAAGRNHPSTSIS